MRDAPAVDLGALGRPALEREQAVRQQLRRRLVARDDQQEQEADHLVVAQGVAIPGGGAQRGGEVVGHVTAGGRGAALGHEVVEVLEQVGRGLDTGRQDLGPALLPIEQRVGPVAQLRLVGFGHAEHARDHVHRESRRVVGDEVAVVAFDEAAEKPAGQAADLGFEVGDAPRRERATHEPAQLGVLAADRS